MHYTTLLNIFGLPDIDKTCRSVEHGINTGLLRQLANSIHGRRQEYGVNAGVGVRRCHLCRHKCTDDFVVQLNGRILLVANQLAQVTYQLGLSGAQVQRFEHVSDDLQQVWVGL